MDEARAAYSQGEFDRAEELLDRAEEVDPQLSPNVARARKAISVARGAFDNN